MSRRVAAAAVLVASCAGGLLFVPSGVPQGYELEAPGHHPSQTRPAEAEAGLLKSLSFDQSDFFISARNLVFGLTLGLLVSLAGAAPARAVNGNQYSVPDRLPDSAWTNWPKDVPWECHWPKDCTITQAKAWGKAKAALWNLERLPGWDDKYSKSSTGVGVWRKYKMDLAWHMKESPQRVPGLAGPEGFVRDAADGTYDLPPYQDPKKDYPGNYPYKLPLVPGPARQYDYRDDGFYDYAPYKSRNHQTLKPPVNPYK
eukprot:TRINITY_DN394_c0_g1_i4.p1 TRINITY_DN394_c0_g1~~TRINITY_DN394_c0_g1_i4.p1  ORF type:complete len:257 (-),score=35.21 TRINITY_DN394_c0_g1_i4:301-1071(-)